MVATLIASSVMSVAASPEKMVSGELHAIASETSYRGGLVTPPLAKPRFTLTDTAGAAFDFGAQTEGYVTLLFFGYTHCPNECPLHMAAIAMALRDVPADVRNQVKVVFVTADPARDTVAVLRAWLANFDKQFIGLTGSPALIEAAQLSAKIPAATKTVFTSRPYEVAHASFVLAYTKDNLAHVIYPGGVTAIDWKHDLSRLVNEKWSSR